MQRRCYMQGLSAHFLQQYFWLENIAAEVVVYQNLNRDTVPPKDLWSLDESTPILQFWFAEVCSIFSALRVSEPLNLVMLVMLFSSQMQPTLTTPCHFSQRLLARSFGRTARPSKASPKC